MTYSRKPSASAAKLPLVFVATTPFAVNAFLKRQLLALAEGFDVTLCVNTKAYPLSEELHAGIRIIHVDMERKISLSRDILALFQLLSVFRRLRPVAVHSLTPKGGLLAMLAGFLARVKLRCHTFTGQVWANKRGLKRWILKKFDCLIAWLATRVFADSRSQCRFLETEGVIRRGAVGLLGAGSIAGVDADRFRPDMAARHAVRAEIGSDEAALVFLFVGRITRDKGVFDLIEAFAALAATRPASELWVVGPDEDGLQDELCRIFGDGPGIVRRFGATATPERYMAAADIFMLPSFREGFGSVVIEAAACTLPAICYRIDGIVDAVVDGETGILVPVGDRHRLTEAMGELAADAARRRMMGTAGRGRAVRDFSADSITREWVRFYGEALLGRRTEAP